MANKKISEKNIRKIGKTGGGRTYYLTIPIDIIEALDWIDGQKVEVSLKGESIVIKDWKKK